jgi:hypothetical protein
LYVTSSHLVTTYHHRVGKGGHGLSIGSLGKNGQVANVSNIVFENAVMIDELYGARFKSWSGGKGIAQK